MSDYREGTALVILKRTTASHFCANPLCTEVPKEHHLVALNVNSKVVTAFLPVCEKHREWVDNELLAPKPEQKEAEGG